ncbi:hypothetical protein INT44_008184 [Umbelopsis vinacea]|uniref:FAR1 domain-containing protein n=1 Tax=Umbelopsis vinacea TaxID=44442 RepID=A0A8H7PPQ4_9FUNG|nr:hypothetical protein INT44_008184 [Umbelopsis vinacea]KAI9285543.1 hypothetical protein BC943DRAFT_323547 [Umbelopsis sp. AD052]
MNTMPNLDDVLESPSESTTSPTGEWKPPPGHMDSFYTRLLKLSFPDSISAIEYCRELSSQYGFTVKQEASSNRNIYVYCSREGVPDSQRNPKPSPQRKRPSKRCDCRWRIVLFENDQERWEFRKSVNAASSEHNHEMMHPDDMVKSWPKEVTDMIVDLARKRWATHEIRSYVQNEFQGIIWNERRFYNRLSEERKKIKHRETVDRVQRLTNITTRLCTVAAASDEWTNHAEQELIKLFNSCCQFAHIVPDSIPSPIESSVLTDDGTDGSLSLSPASQSMGDMRSHTPLMSSYNDCDEALMSPTKRRRVSSIVPPLSSNGHPHCKESSRGSQAVTIPSYTIHVKSQAIRTSSTADNSIRRNQHSKSPSNVLYTPESPASTTSIHHSQQPFVSPTTPTSMHSTGSSARPDVPMHMQGQYNLYQQPYDNNFQLTSPMPGYMQFQSYNAMQHPPAGSGNFNMMDDGLILPQRTRSLPPQHHPSNNPANRDQPQHLVDYRSFPLHGHSEHLRLKHEPDVDLHSGNMHPHNQDMLPAVGQTASHW